MAPTDVPPAPHDPDPAVDPLLQEGPEGDQPMSFFDHLDELRSRLVRSALGLVVAFIAAWIFRSELLGIIKGPFRRAWVALELEGTPELQVLGVFDAFFADVRIALTAGLFLSGPILFYQLWMFVSPGLYAREKRYVIPFVGLSAVMFVLGAGFCYEFVLPYATEWFLSYPLEQQSGGVVVKPQYTLPNYIVYTTKLLLGFGLMFELPLAIFFMAVAGVITHRTLLRYWKIAVLIIFIVSAFLTPPDPVTIFFMAIPMCALFFLSIAVAYFASRSHREAEAALDGPHASARGATADAFDDGHDDDDRDDPETDRDDPSRTARDGAGPGSPG